MSGSDANSVIRKIFLVLDAFRGSVGPVGGSELARRTGLSKTTVFRLIRELQDVGALVRVGDGYRIGLRLFELGSLHYPEKLRDALQPFMEDLHEATGLIVLAGVLDGRDVVFLEYHAPRRGPRLGSRVGTQVPANCSACGKIMLAALPEAELDRLIHPPLPALTPRSITDPDALRAELAQIRIDDVAFEHEEMSVGVSAVAVPIRHPRGWVTSGLVIAGATKSIDFEKLIPALRVTSSLMTRAGSRAWMTHRDSG